MTPSSAKAKGRLHQQWVRDKILYYNPELSKDDVRSTSMGAGGEDVQLSTKARELFPYQVECKSKAKYAVYTDYAQAETHGNCEPLLVIKQNAKKPLVVVDAEHFVFLIRTMHELLTEQRYREQGHRHE